MTNIFAVLFQCAAAPLRSLRAGLAERLPARDMALLGTFSRPRALHALDEPVGRRASWASCSSWSGGRRLLRPRELASAPRLRGLARRRSTSLSYVPLVIAAARVARAAQRAELSGPRAGRRERLVEEQRNVWRYHANLNATHPYFSKWWTWPWLYRPTWYFYEQQERDRARDRRRRQPRSLVALGARPRSGRSSPGPRARDPRRLFAAAGFCLLYLPWGVSPRTLNYGHYLFEAIPYACLSLGMLLDRLWDGPWRHGAPARS